MHSVGLAQSYQKISFFLSKNFSVDTSDRYVQLVTNLRLFDEGKNLQFFKWIYLVFMVWSDIKRCHIYVKLCFCLILTPPPSHTSICRYINVIILAELRLMFWPEDI